MGGVANVSTAATAVIAVIALNTWKQQSKTQNITVFLDKLTDEVHEYLQTMTTPVQVLKIIEIALKCYTPQLDDAYKNNTHANVISYITKKGKSDSILLFDSLNKCNQSKAKIQSLLAKGQIYNFEKYIDCYNSCQMLLWQHDRLQVVAAVIGSDSMNWDNPLVQNSIDNMLSVNSDDVQKHFSEQHIKYLEFTKANYHAAY